ncbi:MAG: hypothetical protein KDE14_05715 [Rhodobacteraceae bacterium]|nr:hypothetical protein [Paracoccaceae bacterium]
MRFGRAALTPVLPLAVVLAFGAPPAAQAACTVDEISSAGVTGFQEAVISVGDLDAALNAWRDVGEFEVICTGTQSQAEAVFWGVPAETRIDEVVLRKPGMTRGFVRLVKFNGLPQVQIRSSGMTWDSGGILDLYMYVDNTPAVFDRLRALGWQSYNDPVTYSLSSFTITEVIVRGPNGEALCLMQRDAPPYDKTVFGLVDGSGKGFGWPFNSALASADYEPGAKFFGETLGWKMHLGGESKSEPPGDNPLGLPKNLAIELPRKFGAFAPHPTDRNGSIQVITSEGIVGRDFSGRAHAPNLGILTLRVPVPDLDAFARDFTAKGGKIAAPARDLAIAPYGKVKMLAIAAPNGARIEFFENH